MKDIKSLYFAAKSSMKPSDISLYESAVHEIFESDPQGYISNLEYIISSDIGLRTLKEFVETNGLPIRCYDNVMTVLEKCLEKCQSRKKDDAEYKEAISYMESFRNKYVGCFMMESFFDEQLPNDYVETYYAKNEKKFPNRKLLTGMISKFGEAAIPDILITADSIGESAITTALEYISNSDMIGNPVIYEWVLESVKNFVPESNPALSDMASMSVRRMVENVQERNHQIYRESVITGNDLMMEYSEIDIKAIRDLISINEYKLTWADELTESVSDIQSKIYSLYEELDGVVDVDGKSLDLFSETTADSLIPMLPNAIENEQAKPMNEGWLLNTRNKKTGEIPGYLKKNHDLGYGEDDGRNNSPSGSSITSSDDVQSEPTLDDFKRPSAEDISEPYSGLDDEQKKEPEQLTPAEQRAINNYYYYTYNNSLNKNTTGSFNRDSSTHSTTKKTVDDHSSNKRINSDNVDPVEKLESVLALDIPFSESSKGDKTKLLSFIKNHKERKKPDVKVIEGYAVSKKDYGSILKRIDEANDQLKNIVKKYDDKYPIYGLKVLYDKKIQSYGLSDGFEGLGVRKVQNYRMFEDLGDEYIFDIGYLLLSAFKVSEFTNNLKNKYPDEYKKLQNEFDRNPAKDPEDTPDPEDTTDLIDVSESTNSTDEKDYPVDWSSAMNSYKFLDYDKNLMEIWAHIGMDVLKEIKGSLNYDSWSGEEYAWYGFYISAKTLYPDFDEKNIRKLDVSTISNFAKNLPGEMKKIYFNEAVGDADKDRPQSDHPVKDVLTDIDRELMKKQQGAKKAVQNVQNAGRAFVKPAVRTKQWITNMVSNWKDADENNIKEKMADPHARSNLFSAIRKAIIGGSLLKAGLLLNPVFLTLTVTRGFGKNKREFRLRNEMIGELKTELGIIDEKIKDADRVGDNKAKYQLMRFKNELNKKLLRVGGSKEWKKII